MSKPDLTGYTARIFRDDLGWDYEVKDPTGETLLPEDFRGGERYPTEKKAEEAALDLIEEHAKSQQWVDGEELRVRVEMKEGD
jgi:hypothetical protein